MVVTEDLVKRACAAYDANKEVDGDDYPCEYPAMWHALTAAMASMWRPVSEAPKDGTESLFVTRSGKQRVDSYKNVIGGLFWQERPTDRYIGFMPLPAPPAAVGGG